MNNYLWSPDIEFFVTKVTSSHEDVTFLRQGQEILQLKLSLLASQGLRCLKTMTQETTHNELLPLYKLLVEKNILQLKKEQHSLIVKLFNSYSHLTTNSSTNTPENSPQEMIELPSPIPMQINILTGDEFQLQQQFFHFQAAHIHSDTNLSTTLITTLKIAPNHFILAPVRYADEAERPTQRGPLSCQYPQWTQRLPVAFHFVLDLLAQGCARKFLMVPPHGPWI